MNGLSWALPLLLAACSGEGPFQTGSDADTDTDVADAGFDASCPADAGEEDAGVVEDICGCLRDTEFRACRAVPSISCSAPEDCCDDASPIPCGYFGNKFTCAASRCEPAPCESHSECRTVAEASGLPDSQAWGCLDPICGVGTATCGIGARECEEVDDCCLRDSDIPCGEYGNRWNCASARCSTRPCECDADCAEYARTTGQDGDWVCARDACSDFRTCVPRRPCAGDDDCCDGASPVPCGTFGNRWTCRAGQCFEDGCDEDAECATYAGAMGLPEPGQWECPR